MARNKRSELEAQMKEFLARGGKIKQVGQTCPLTDAQFERHIAEIEASALIGQKEAENESDRHHAYYGE